MGVPMGLLDAWFALGVQRDVQVVESKTLPDLCADHTHTHTLMYSARTVEAPTEIVLRALDSFVTQLQWGLYPLTG